MKTDSTGATQGGASAWRNAASQAAEYEAIDLPLPSGFVCKATRPPLDVWFVAGAVPTDLMEKVQAAVRSSEDEEGREAVVREALQTDPAQAIKLAAFMRDAVMHAVVWPRIVLDADPSDPNQMSLKEIPPKDFQHIVAWVMAGCPGVPVKMANGRETTVEAVETFRPKSALRPRRTAKSKVRHPRKPKNRG